MHDDRHCLRATLRGIALLVVLALVGSVAGCTTWRGARLYQTGTDALESGETNRALADLGAASELVPERSEVWNHLGLAQLEAGQPDAAEASFRTAVALDCANQAASQNLDHLEQRRRQAAQDALAAAAGAADE